ncbi:DMT family transporter [Candidatus Pseudothioglobus singularis]|nr:DMT family transporter [Candidatus Pseudothioglobus singularis]MBT3674733.1 DMT family transporter [Pseudomonadota bacterium]MDG1167069.1 DMT family transporter [Candidatus Thioglobus sp.]MDA9336024.1 DMT family transporter [Candidatus Pseudothioglobus singularis]MDC0492070.1 DMT family transporter [Candidatus Pseudothioglobus singularis]MDC0597361.1 DMT family transporter [Candidatus Pseudothioglobus singularis]
MKNKVIRADLIMLLAAAIWGFAFVAQREGMETMGPFLFNAARFFIGSAVLFPLVWYLSKKNKTPTNKETSTKKLLIAGTIAGLFLFLASSFQQVGIQYTTAGKAGFITGLYIFFVPLIGIFFGQRTGSGTWLGAFIAVIGLYLLSINDDFSIARGDLLQLICAVFFAAHILVVGYVAKRMDPLKLSLIQYVVSGVLSFFIAIAIELITWQMIVDTAIPLLYAGVMSIGVGYTLQVVAQQHAKSSHAAIILGLEGAFAVLGGWLILDENLSTRGLIGCGLMLSGMFLSQLLPRLSLKKS